MRENNERPVCHRAEDLVTYLYGEASNADALDFRNHLQQCNACRSEFTVFSQVHNSIELWRNEALGASFNPAAITGTASIESNEFAQHERRLSALAAVREFFTVSPLWLRGVTAFAALLLCALGVMMISRSSQKPIAVANKGGNEKMYTQQQLQAEVSKAVDRKVRELTATTQNPASSVAGEKDKPKPDKDRVQIATSRQPKTANQRLTRQEREQLAADLRLTTPADEEEMMLAFPEQENPN